MRPEDFSPGNASPSACPGRCAAGFNEAGGFLPRKLGGESVTHVVVAPRFNEAGGFLPRKRPAGGFSREGDTPCFNEAGGFLPRKPYGPA